MDIKILFQRPINRKYNSNQYRKIKYDFVEEIEGLPITFE